MPLNLTLLSLYRADGQELSSLPGLLAIMPPPKVARGREHQPLLLALHLNGNTPFSTADYMKLTNDAATAFYHMHGALTTALRVAAESVNRTLLERNLSTTGRGQYVIGWLTLGVLREAQLTILQCGPTHVIAYQAGTSRHLYDPALSGKGLGLNQTVNQYFSQIELGPGDRLLLCPTLPVPWENALASDRGLPALESTRKRLLALVEADVSGVLIQVTEGKGELIVPHETTPLSSQKAVAPSPPVDSIPAIVRPQLLQEDPSQPAHVIKHPPVDEPSAYAIPPQPALDDEALIEQLATAAMMREFPPSIPRAHPSVPDLEQVHENDELPVEDEIEVSAPSRPLGEIDLTRIESKRQAARLAVNGIQTWRRLAGRIGAGARKFLPHLLPGGESEPAWSMSVPVMAFLAVAIPVLVVTIASIVYIRFGRSSQYEIYITQAETLRVQAMNETDPVLQRQAWDNVLDRVAQAEGFGITSKTIALRQEAQTRLDALLGISRLNFSPAFSTGVGAEISRMAASDTDLYMLDAAHGEIMRAALTGHGYTVDNAFNCAPGPYGELTVGPLVDLLILPKSNMLNSTVLGTDAAGNLLYCSPDQLPRALSLTPPDTNWGRVVAMTLENNKLYVLDSPSRAVWIYNGKEQINSDEDVGTFPDAPYFFFGIQIPDIQDAIDIAVSGDDLYLLHADGRLTHCTYSHIVGIDTQCESPVKLVNSFPAYGGSDVFSQAHFTQMTLTGLPDLALLLLDADGQMVYRLSTRVFELQAIFGAAGDSLPLGVLGAMTASPNHILYVARGDQVYITNDAP